MRILITGGAGFIGRHLVRRLLADSSNQVTVLDNLRRASRPAADRSRFLEGDIRDRDVLAQAMDGVDVVFHLAAQSNVIGAVTDLEYSFTTNVAGTFGVLAAARAAGVRKVVFTSSREVYGQPSELPVVETARLAPKNAYGASKLAGEEYCRVYQSDGLPVTILRLANVFGPGDEDRVIPIFIRNALRDEPLTLYGGGQIVDFVWIGTVVDALLKAVEYDSSLGPVNIGSALGTTVSELAALILQHIPSAGGIRRLEPRQVEVSEFIANVDKAKQYGFLETAGEPPLRHLGEVVRSYVRLAGETAADTHGTVLELPVH